MENGVILTLALCMLMLVLAIVILICVRRIAVLNAEKSRMVEEKAALEGRAIALEGQIKAREESYRALEAQRAEQMTAIEQERSESAKRIAEEREKAFEIQRKQMEESFKLLAEQNSAGLRRQNAESIAELLKPIQDKFSGFEKSVQESQAKNLAQDASMRELLKNLMDQSRSVGDEARNLANALTGKSKIQGNFGEMLLINLLKQSGLEEGVHFVQQGVIRDKFGHEVRSDTGNVMIPDVIVYYPDDTEVIIDSKVSLSAYVNWANATSIEDRERFAHEHVDSVARHIDELKTKDYASYIENGRRKVDYNIMFIPMEGAFRLMLEEAPTLWQKAKDAKVLIVSQMNLMVVLNMILMSWKQHDQEKNIADVYQTASELMSQLKGWMEAYTRLGELIGKADEAYKESKLKLVDGKQSVIHKIDKLEKLGLSPKRSNARIKTNTRVVGGRESIIPKALADGLDSNEIDNIEQ